MRGKNGLRSLKRLLYFPFLVCMFLSFFFLSLIQESVSCSITTATLTVRDKVDNAVFSAKLKRIKISLYGKSLQKWFAQGNQGLYSIFI